MSKAYATFSNVSLRLKRGLQEKTSLHRPKPRQVRGAAQHRVREDVRAAKRVRVRERQEVPSPEQPLSRHSRNHPRLNKTSSRLRHLLIPKSRQTIRERSHRPLPISSN